MSFLLDVLDYVPIVGTVKNTVEAFVASASGDEEKAKEKLTSALVGGVLDAVTLGSGSIVAKSAGKMGGKALARTGTRVLVKRSITKVAAKTTAQQVAVNVSGRAVSKLMLGNTNGPNNEEERPPSKKGEHVINNNVLNVYRDIVRSFVNDVMHDNLDGMINRYELTAVCWVNPLRYTDNITGEPAPNVSFAFADVGMTIEIINSMITLDNTVPFHSW